MVQGRKQVVLGNETYVYDRARYLAVSMELPVMGNVLEATPEVPYLCMTLRVDPRELAALIVETGRPVPPDDHDGRALYLSLLQAPLLDGLVRLVRLLDTPEDVPVLAPLVLREIDYRLLQSEQFGRLAQMAIGDGRLRRVSGAIAWIKDHFAEPLQIKALATRVHMSPSALHHHFKAATAMSPISTRSSCGCRRLAVFCYRLRRARRRSPTRWGTRVHRSSAANTPGSLASHRVETRNACAMPWLV